MNVSWRTLFASVALVTAMASDTCAEPDFGASCITCHNQRSDGALTFLPSNLLAIPAGDMGQITFDVTDIGNSGNAAIGLVGLDAAGLMATPDLAIWNNQTDGIDNWLTSDLFNMVGPVVLKLTIAAGATPADYPINLALAGRDTQRWGTTRSFTVRVLMAGVPGDYNSDGKVDAADYVVWRKTDGTQAGYNTWRSNFGATAGSGSGAAANTAVPEPAALVMLIVGILAMCFRRRATVS